MISIPMTPASTVSIASLIALALLGACGRKDCCAPPAVASVTVSPASASVVVGETTQLNATDASVTVSPASASVVVGETTQLNATVKDAAGTILTGRVVAWSSSNTTVATASSTGLVTGVTANAVTVITA